MKNKIFIQTLNKVKPSKEKKDKMLENILTKKTTSKISMNYVWKFGMVSLCFVCSFFIMNGFYQEDKSLVPASIEPRTLMEESNEFCYQSICYEKIGVLKNRTGLQYLDTIEDSNGKKIIYQGEQKDTIIIKYENSYFLYQKIER